MADQQRELSSVCRIRAAVLVERFRYFAPRSGRSVTIVAACMAANHPA